VDAKTPAAADQRFNEVIRTEQDLRQIVGPANKWFTAKILTRLDRRCRQFIAASPFVVVGSSDPLGMVDLSPKGDHAGFVRCLDTSTLAIPDRRGNNRIDTLRNILHDPRVALLFLIPGCGETIRVNGRAKISTDPALVESFLVDGKAPRTVILVSVDRIYFQCAKAIVRSKLWDASRHIDRKSLPSAGTSPRRKHSRPSARPARAASSSSTARTSCRSTRPSSGRGTATF